MAPVKLNQEDLLLAGMSASKEAVYTPVQLQKLFFLIDKEIGNRIGGPYFNFIPYNYGPFDKHLYDYLKNLENQGKVQILISASSSLPKYKVTTKGFEEGERVLNEGIEQKLSGYIKLLNEYVLSLSFSDLLSAIYKKYPDMKKNSIFVNK
jgi:hypothetical protein